MRLKNEEKYDLNKAINITKIHKQNIAKNKQVSIRKHSKPSRKIHE